MGSLRVGRVGSALVFGLVAALAGAADEDDPQAKKRLGVMQAAVEALEAKSDELKPKALAPAAKPLLRYSDPTRGLFGGNFLLDAGVWRLGSEGRPTALVTLEIYRNPNGSHLLSYEFLSLTPAQFALKHKTEKVRWDATESGLDLKPLPDAAKPAATAPARLTQMRQIARRFGAKETLNKETTECRLIAQPIDRYQSEAEKIMDGTIFALANGTNPEVGIFLECDADNWRYGVVRLSSAELKVTLDGKQVAAFENVIPGPRTDGSYNSGSHKLELDK